jgi:hypothetical protein
LTRDDLAPDRDDDREEAETRKWRSVAGVIALHVLGAGHSLAIE